MDSVVDKMEVVIIRKYNCVCVLIVLLFLIVGGLVGYFRVGMMIRVISLIMVISIVVLCGFSMLRCLFVKV